MEPDGSLLRRYAETGDETAFAELVRRQLGLVYGAALRQVGGDPHRAQEVAQAVFSDLARKASSLAGRPILASWLHTSTRFAATKLRRAEVRRWRHEQEAATVKALLDEGQGAAEWDRLRPVIDEAVQALGERDREAVLQRFFADRAFAEIGAALGVSEDAARMRVERALEKLRGLLARRGVTSTAAALGVVLAGQAKAGVAALPTGLATCITQVAVTGASVGGGAAVTVGMVEFMSTGKAIMGLTALIAAVGIGCAVYESRQAGQAAGALAALREERIAETAKLRSTDAHLLAAAQREAAGAARIATLEQDLAAAKKSATAGPSGVETVPELWSKPGYAKLNADKFRTALPLRYGPLYRTLHLTPEQITRFEDALTEGEMGVYDIWAAAGSQGIATVGDSATGTSLARMTSGPLGAAQEAVKTVLGAEGYEKFQQYDKPRAARDLVTSLAGNVYFTETPLTAQQGEALAGILAANTTTLKIPMASDGKDPLYLINDVTDWERVDALARGVLSDSQLKALRLLAEKAKLDLEIQRTANSPSAPEKKSGR